MDLPETAAKINEHEKLRDLAEREQLTKRLFETLRIEVDVNDWKRRPVPPDTPWPHIGTHVMGVRVEDEIWLIYNDYGKFFCLHRTRQLPDVVRKRTFRRNKIFPGKIEHDVKSVYTGRGFLKILKEWGVSF